MDPAPPEPPIANEELAPVPIGLWTIAAAVSALGFYLKWITAGYLTFIPGLFLYPVVCLIHLLAHITPAKALVERPKLRQLIWVSHACFVGAILLQYDVGDGPGWLTITEMFGVGVHWPFGDGVGIVWNFLLFIPAAWTWWQLGRESRS